MADPRAASAPARLAVTVAAVAATIGGSLVIAAGDAGDASTTGGAGTLPPLPSLEPSAPVVPRPRAPIATTRSSR